MSTVDAIMVEADYSREIFEEHNADVKRLWKEFAEGRPHRIPVLWSMNYKMILLDPSLNVWGYSFMDVFEKPDVMLRVILEFEYWKRHNVWCDWEMGLPDKWDIAVSFQNVYESAWLGAPIFYSSANVPDIRPFLRSKEDMRKFMERGIPDPFSGFMSRVKRFYEYFLERREEGFTFKGVPIGSVGAPIGTDGPFTIAVNITGGEIIKVLCSDPSFAEEFLWFITNAIIERMKSWHKLLGRSFPYEDFSFADDSIQLLSPNLYRRFVLPLHKEIVKTFCSGRPGIHLCGAIEQHLKILKEELNIRYIDTGFPLNLERAREILGEDVIIRGNLNIMTLLEGPKERIGKETLMIINSQVTRGRRFIFGEGNNVAPRTPPEHLNYAYEIVKKCGEYRY
ncbi:hypothetical protein KEJ29_06370 [Candidatus Bathyarchaeota archaeon]|nr:hypothetical protein [Candidatus Bathyarchaeota archaeon]